MRSAQSAEISHLHLKLCETEAKLGKAQAELLQAQAKLSKAHTQEITKLRKEIETALNLMVERVQTHQ